MKTILKFRLVLAVVLTAVGAHANNADFYLHVKKEQGKTIRFALNDVKETDLSIFDADEKLIYSENISGKNGVNRTYDLSELPKGTYFLEVETTAKVARYEITVSDKVAVLSKKATTETYKPVLTANNGFVTLNIANTEKSAVGLKIYDSNQNEVYSETLKGAPSVSKKFDISNSTGEKYTFVMTYDNKSFIESIASR